MPEQDEFVVQYSTEVDMYLVSFVDPQHCEWGNARDAIVYGTLAAAQSVAAMIGGGTVGTTKP